MPTQLEHSIFVSVSSPSLSSSCSIRHFTDYKISRSRWSELKITEKNWSHHNNVKKASFDLAGDRP
jgi:hypothetical protein